MDRGTFEPRVSDERNDDGHASGVRSAAIVALGLIVACGSAREISAPSGASTELAQCTRCHGNEVNSAPPRSARGLTETRELGVGAHQSHLRGGEVRTGIACGECHVVPDRVDAPGHLDAAGATVRFGPLASTGGADPAWNRDAASCANVYCHGSTLGEGGAAPTWTRVDGTQAACGTCHGVPPSAGAGHPTVSAPGLGTCFFCHRGTVKSDGTIDVAGGKHVDGTVDTAP